jgi:hypothetical protein
MNTAGGMWLLGGFLIASRLASWFFGFGWGGSRLQLR